MQRQALTQDAAITAKWTRLGGAAVVGTPTASVVALQMGLVGEYQTFTNGVIVSSDDFGAVYLSQPIFDKWVSLIGQTDAFGLDLFVAVGRPTTDTVETEPSLTSVTFERGQIHHSSALPSTSVIYGSIYAKYASMASQLGFPAFDEVAAPGGGRVQKFQYGDLYWRADLLQAIAVLSDIRFHFDMIGGVTSVLGYPVSDTGIVYNADSDPVGRTSGFENGAIYFSPATGTRVLTGNIWTNYETKFGGPNGGLGFPIGDEGIAASGDRFVDFQGGVLVDHTGSNAGTFAFMDLQFYVDRFDSFGDDCDLSLCGSQDPYWYISGSTSTGTTFSGSWGEGGDADWEVGAYFVLPKAQSNLSIAVTFSGIDVDDTSPNDSLGSTTTTYDINNLWGKFDSNDHEASSSDGGVYGTYTIKNRVPFDEGDYIGTRWWSFRNTSTPELTTQQFSATFDDVNNSELWYLNPFNEIYFHALYKRISENGFCYGMSLESIYAERGRSPYSQPIFDYFPDTATGGNLLPTDGAHASLLNQINIKQGYQLGANQIGWALATVASGQTHDPVAQFLTGEAFEQAHEKTLVTLSDYKFFNSAHTVRARSYEFAGPSCSLAAPFCHRIHIADPNHPKGNGGGNDFIEIDPTQNYYRYRDFDGGVLTGGRLFVTPFRLLSHQQITPYANPIQLIENGVLLISGSTGKLVQASDESGRTVFEPGLSGIPERWEDLRQDPAKRLPGLSPIPIAMDGPMPVQLWAGRDVSGTSHSYDFAPAADVPAGVSYQVTFDSPLQSAAFSIPGTPSKPDRIVAGNIGTQTKFIEVSIPPDSVAKPITFTIGGTNKNRWAEFSAMNMAPAQKIRMHTEKAGYRVRVENDGPATSAFVRVSAGKDATPVELGNLPIPTGISEVNFDVPRTTIEVSGEVPGKNGWLVAPVTISLSATEYTGKGLDAIEYSPDNVTWTKYTGPFQYEVQGASLLYYRARDKELNQEPASSRAFKIDTVPPSATGQVTTSNGLRLVYSVTDPLFGSGPAGLHTLVQGMGGPVAGFSATPSGTIELTGTSCSRIEYWAEDLAGNVQSPHAVSGDSQKPVVSGATSVTSTHCTAASGLVISASATDDCAVISLTNDAPAKFPPGTTTVTWIAKDAAGNEGKLVQTVTTELADDPSCCPAGAAVKLGTTGNDTLNGTSGVDCLIGLGGQDTLKGFGGNDALSGGPGDDLLWTGDGDDWAFGGTGQDKLYGEGGSDTLVGSDGVDWLYGGIGNDTLFGGRGGDRLFGEAGNDFAYGEGDDDQIDGGSGNDYLNGGLNHDTYQGGGGADQCVQDGGDTLGGSCTAVPPP